MRDLRAISPFYAIIAQSHFELRSRSNLILTTATILPYDLLVYKRRLGLALRERSRLPNLITSLSIEHWYSELRWINLIFAYRPSFKPRPIATVLLSFQDV
ncbi:hypothetical protein PIIN_11163 [Serendipita indica DSM 11827]|uniref:Uncharacterized protein n=1 Tax=Serendipita indica (strain DSM 11827) TaxID=1109443 RepID=G4U0T8_SERID|nr:hypothetical protein PIIN_11163 [Serendipita indica DSM 11827]